MIFINYYLLPFLTRFCLVVMFPFSAYDKIVHWDGALRQARSAPVPGSTVMLILAIIVEFITPLCIVTGWHDRMAAFVLAGFCAITALLYHPFWKFPDFWSKDGEGRGHFWDFLKNFGLVGGLLFVVDGVGFAPLSYVLAHPLGSLAYGASP